MQGQSMDNQLKEFCIRIGDNSLVLGHRLSEWCGHGPILEEDIAMSNMALDLIGQARGFLSYAAKLEGKGRSEDDLAYHRDAREFRNRMLVEQPNGDFAVTMVRSLLYSAISYLQFRELCKSKDETVSGLAEKSLKEVTYHLRHSGEWVIRLGDGTQESHQRTQAALDELWMYTEELFEMDETDAELIRGGIACNLDALRNEWDQIIVDILKKATLKKPEGKTYQSKGGIKGIHTEHLGYLLAEMQFLPRAYPGTSW
jgi:ring-1,2-phenylacetyl-CoA epoxidase subunit PaaC